MLNIKKILSGSPAGDAFRAVSNYKKKIDERSYAGSIDEQLWQLMGERDWSDNILHYSDISKLFLKEMSDGSKFGEMIKTNISDRVAGGAEAVAAMFYNMIEFCRFIDLDNYRAHLLIFELEHFSDGFTEHALRRMAVEYTLKTQALLSYNEIDQIIAKHTANRART